MATPPLIVPDSATIAAKKAVAGPLSGPRWRFAFGSASAQSPLLVQELDRDDAFYYIVPFDSGERVTGRIIVDAVTNEFAEAAGVDNDQDTLPPFVNPTALLAAWYDKPFEVEGIRVSILRSGTVGIQPQLGWRPCDQSLSPFEPFYLLTIRDRVVYLRVDGERFGVLTTSATGA